MHHSKTADIGDQVHNEVKAEKRIVAVSTRAARPGLSAWQD